LLAGQLGIGERRSPHIGERRLPTDDFGHQAVDERGIGAQLGHLLRMVVQREQASGHRVARSVVAADDQQGQVAHELDGPHVPRRRPVGQHGNQIGTGRRIDSLVPQPGEIFQHLAQFGHAHLRIGCVGIGQLIGGDHVGPMREQPAVLQRKVEEGCEHVGGQFDRDQVHPVECFIAWQAVEYLDGALADQTLPVVEVRRRYDRAHRLALRVVFGRIHRDEHRQLLFIAGREVHQCDALLRRKNTVAGIHLHDVPVAGHRPVAVDAGYRAARAVNGILAAKTLEDVARRIVDEPLRIGRIQSFKG
jgi:hypothetical protein